VELRCSECGRVADPSQIACLVCGGLLAFQLDAFGDDATTIRARLRERRFSNLHVDQSGVWRYRELLPEMPHSAIVTLRENMAPLYDGPAGAAYAQIGAVTYLHLGMNPTGSFKDAGMTVAVSRAKATGARACICASTGNTAAAMAAYGKRAGIVPVVLVPASGISESKVAQTLDYGATVIAIDGDFDAALETVRRLDPTRIAIVNSINPYRIEGQKTAAFQLLEARDWRVPDWVVLPGGNMGNTSAFGKGFREALALGLIDRLPRLAVVQASGAAPFARLVNEGGEMIPVVAKTTATAIKIGAPASWKKALAEIRTTRGTALAVSDEQIADAKAIVGRDGIGCEPASAASLAGLRILRERGTIEAGDDVVLVLTGHVLKDPTYSAAYHGSTATFANRIVRARDEADLLERIDAATVAAARA
jgi:threonine synthase